MKTSISFVTLVLILSLVAGSCSSPAQSPQSVPEATSPAQSQTSAESEPSPATPPAPEPEPEITGIILNDPVDDFFDESGNPTSDEPYLDIISAKLTTEDNDYMLSMNLNGPLPDSTPDSTFLYEWNIYVDADSSLASGTNWPNVINDLGSDYMARLMLLDSTYHGEVYEFSTKNKTAIQYSIKENTVELRWPKKDAYPDTFDFVVTTKKYGERGSSGAFILADKAPELGHCSFPEGCIDVFSSSKTPVNRVQFTDPANDVLDRNYNNVNEPYLDIVETTFSSYGTYGIFTLTVNGDVPLQTENPSECLYWGLTIDVDDNPATGRSLPEIINDLGAESQVQLSLCGSKFSTQLFDLVTGHLVITNMDYRIDKDTVKIQVPLPADLINEFGYVALARKYGNHGAADSLLMADKAPDEGHYRFP